MGGMGNEGLRLVPGDRGTVGQTSCKTKREEHAITWSQKPVPATGQLGLTAQTCQGSLEEGDAPSNCCHSGCCHANIPCSWAASPAQPNQR